MTGIWRAIARHLPHRRRRFWRYVSPQRRGAGLLLLLLLLTGVYAYWYLTNDSRVREQAQEFLHRLTRGPVHIEKAHFSLFGGVELENVRLYVPADDSPDPLFAARKVKLRHWPWGLFLTGQLQPTEIDCIDAVITLERKVLEDRADGAYTYGVQKLFAMASVPQPSSGPQKSAPMPVINFRGCKLRYTELRYEQTSPKCVLYVPALVPAGLGTPVLPWSTVTAAASGRKRELLGQEQLDVIMVPRPDNLYVITFEQSDRAKGGIGGSVQVNLSNGRYVIAGRAPIQNLDEALPARYRQWRRLYSLDGPFDYSYDGQSSRAEIGLKGVSLRLPEAEGGVELSDVRGTLVLDLGENAGIELKDVTGSLAQCGGARLTLSGRYGGYDKDSPFELSVGVKGMALPGTGVFTGELGRIVQHMHAQYRPSGVLDVQARVTRRDGAVTYEGQATLNGMDVTYLWFPYPAHDVRGTLSFNEREVRLENIRGRAGEGEVVVSGRAGTRADTENYDIRVSAPNMAFDDTLKAAAPPDCLPAWRLLSPEGIAGIDARISRQPGQKRSIEVAFTLDSRASVMYSGFPMRMGNLTGTVVYSNGSVTVDSVSGSRGDMTCRLSGTIDKVGQEHPTVDLDLAARQVVLDEALRGAMAAASSGGIYDSLSLSGRCRAVDARIKRQGDEPLDLDVLAELDGASASPKAFPYAMTDISGTVRITREFAELGDLRARHGGTKLTLGGKLGLAGDGAVELAAAATAIEFDKDLYAALDEDLRRVWRSLSPQGQADLNLKLSRSSGKSDYLLELSPTGMKVKYEGFPYRLDGVTGKVVATPRSVELKELSGVRGSMKAQISGVVSRGDGADKVRLAVKARGLPIDAELLDALGPELSALRSSLSPGGVCDLDLTALELVEKVSLTGTGAALPASAPASGPANAASAPASAPAPSRWASWSVSGSLAVQGAIIDAGVGAKTITGSLSGTAAGTPAGVALAAQAQIGSIAVGRRQVTDLSAKLTKSASGQLLRIDDMRGRSCGGSLAGFAEIRLSNPLEYGLSVTMSGADLAELFGPTGTGAKSDVSGELAGNLQVTGVAGKPASTRAAGKVRIGGAKIRQLPVPLGLVNVVFLSLPGDSPFQEGDFTYHLEGDKLVFDEIHFQGAATSIVGSGSMDMRTDALKLVFLANPAGKLPGLGELTHDLLRGLMRQIVEIHVSGTVARPVTRTVPLRSLDELIQRITSPGE
jgi:hypothetical protein